jgi:hypothetical protein
MSHQYVQPPDLFPILSPGKHRSPRTGACFMELASLLAGERWSDHPACTHPLLAAVARHVNDHSSDARRQRLAEPIPSVIGLTGDDLHIDARMALRSAIMALPVVAANRQRVMAVSVLTCDPHLGRAGRASSSCPRGAEPLGPGGRSAGRRVGLSVHHRGPALRQGLSPAGRAHHRSRCRGGHRAGLRAGSRWDAP